MKSKDSFTEAMAEILRDRHEMPKPDALMSQAERRLRKKVQRSEGVPLLAAVSDEDIEAAATRLADALAEAFLENVAAPDHELVPLAAANVVAFTPIASTASPSGHANDSVRLMPGLALAADAGGNSEAIADANRRALEALNSSEDELGLLSCAAGTATLIDREERVLLRIDRPAKLTWLQLGYRTLSLLPAEGTATEFLVADFVVIDAYYFALDHAKDAKTFPAAWG
jgi:hypothetical protein